MNILPLLYALNVLLILAIPIALAIFLTRRWKTGWSLWWIGAATFILSQVGHIPFNLAASLLLNQTGMVYWPQTAQTLFNAVFAGLSAGVFEEMSRYLVLRFWAKKARSWQAGVLFGAGHGGAEALIIGLLALGVYIGMLVLRSADLSALVPAAQLELLRTQVDAYWSAPWYQTLVGAAERLLAIACQIFLAVLVMQAFLRRNIAWLFAAIGFHALIDASAVLGLQYLGIFGTEALVAVYALASVLLTLRLRRSVPTLDAGAAGAAVSAPPPTNDTSGNPE